MKYRISGARHDTGARVTIELEATSRAAAERQANQAGIDVLHIEQVREQPQAEAPEAHPAHSTHRGEFPPEHHTGRWIAIGILVLIIVLVVMYWDRLRNLLPATAAS
ncbi:hypothetical protein [Fontivita pretiosa]|uniref:hypothetical protein n=1 Tax=Fontivita pretiosa TaxID=2989684 RepID=UPI003D16CE24